MIDTVNKKNKWVLYHADCMDGYAAAWAAWKSFSESACYKAVRHHEPLPDFPDNIELYILDFCYPMATLAAAAERVTKIVVLDHHISAQKEYEQYLKHATIPENLNVVFIQNQSGCMIAWDYFQGGVEPPLLLQHIEDHDLWRHKLAKTEAICKALFLRLPVHFSAFEKIKLNTLQREGAILLKQHQLSIRRLLKTRHQVKLNGVQGLAVNAPAMFSSDLGHALAKLSGTYGLTYSWHGQHECYNCALRSVGEFDVAEIAQQFSGGGHQNASGFNVNQKTFLGFF